MTDIFGREAINTNLSFPLSIDNPRKCGYTDQEGGDFMEILELDRGITLAWCALEGESGHDAGLRLLAALYRRETGNGMPSISRTERGKPYFPGDPLHFSVSHTPRHAFCALSPAPIGIDAEETDRIVRPGLAGKILSPGELRQYDAALDKRRTLLTFWVLKEAAAKLSGEGLRSYPNHSSFVLPDPRVRELGGCLVAILEE